MRPDPRKPKGHSVGLAVNQNHIRLDVAITESFVGSCQGMVAVLDGSGFILVQNLYPVIPAQAGIPLLFQQVATLEARPRPAPG